MKKMLFLGDSSETLEFLQQAKKENIYTIVTDYHSPEYSTAKQAADAYWMISTGDLSALEQKCKEENVQAVISGASDYNIKMSILLCEKLGLPCYCDAATWDASTNKKIFKQFAIETKVPIPADYKISSKITEEELSEVVYPVMVKPSDGCSNLGVSYCYNKEDFVKAYRYAESLSNSKEIIVEQMLSGMEFFAYYALAAGEAAFLTIGIRLPQLGEPRFCYSMTSSINSITKRYLDEMNSNVIHLLKKLGCREGIACVQCMMDSSKKLYAFEMCYSAETSILLAPMRKVCSFDAIAWQFDCSLGKKHSPDELPNISASFYRCANSYILFSNKEGTISEISGFDEIKRLPNVDIYVHAHIGDTIRKYYPLGHIMFDTDNCEQICVLMEKINQTIHIKNTNGEDVLIYFTDFDVLKQEYQKMRSL